jgi:1-acyl-sn-glycerol-3-phosphate acyltransferase
MVGLVRLLFPLMLRTMFGGLRVHIEPEELEKLRRYKGQRMLLLPNHPTGEEPAVMFVISMQLRETFNFVAARELFDLERGFRGWVMRRLGVYSVIRGITDRESFMTSKKILMEGKNRLVIFIEGEISRQNDTLIPFEPGVIQLALWAQEALAKGAGKANRKHPPASPDEKSTDHGAGPDYPPVYIAPVAIKYYYLPGVEAAIEQSILALEKAVGIDSMPDVERYARVRAIAEKVVQVQEGLHQIVSLPGTTMNDRVGAIKHRMLKKIEVFLGLKPDPEASTLERLREIRNMMDRMIHTYEDPQDLSDYEKRTIEHFRVAMSEFYRDLDRVTYFLTYDEAYLRDNQSPEHFIEMLHRLEKEVFGVGKLVYPRVAVVKVGEVIDLKALFGKYEADKKSLAKRLAVRLEENMTAMLAAIERSPGM